MKRIVLIISLIFIILILLLILKINTYSKNILTVVVPHHNLVKKERLDFWKDIIKDAHINSNKIERVIVVGPDHFGKVQTNITYDNTDWTTYSTKLECFFKRPAYFPSNYVLNSVITKNDHAIANLISEIHDNFPNAKFVPFLIGKNVRFADLNYLIKYINSVCNKNCVLVASVDFSHYVTLDVANKQDKKTIELLETKKIKENSLNQNNTIEADSPAALYVMQEFARKNNLKWKLYNHTNSAFGNTQTTNTTSHIFGGLY